MTLDFLKHPLVVLVSLVVAVVSVGLTVYFYLDSREFREPVYIVDEEHKQIFDSTASSPKIKVLDKDSNPVSDNIFLATVIMWNAGKLSIEPEDVRVPLQIKIKPISKLLDYSIVKESDPEITKFQLSELLGLSWLHFDSGYGVKVQLLYSAPEQAEVEITGKIKGVAQIKRLVSGSESIKSFKFLLGLGFIYLLLSMPMIIITVKSKEIIKEKRAGRYQIAMTTALFVFVSSIGMITIALFFLLREANPPL